MQEESTLPFKFDKALGLQTQNTQVSLLKLQGYLVAKDGSITYPQLGKIYVVDVRLVNNKFTVLSEVKAPGTYTLDEEIITLPQALGMAGDLTINGKRENVLIIRQGEKAMETKHIDLTQSDWMHSKFYYLKPNDVVYVTPNNSKVRSAGLIGNVGALLCLASILLSTAIVIFR